MTFLPRLRDRRTGFYSIDSWTRRASDGMSPYVDRRKPGMLQAEQEAEYRERCGQITSAELIARQQYPIMGAERRRWYVTVIKKCPDCGGKLGSEPACPQCGYSGEQETGGGRYA